MAPSSADASPQSLERGEPPTNVRWVILLLLMATAGLSHFNRTSIATAGTEQIIPALYLERMAGRAVPVDRALRDYGPEKTQMGLVYSSYLVIYTLMMIPGGWLIERVGPKRALMVVGFGSALLVPFTSLVGYLAPPGASAWSGLPFMIVALCVVRGALGAVSAPLHPGAARAVSFWFPYQARGLGNGMVTGAALIGIAATPPLFGLLSDKFHLFGDEAGWRSAFLIAGLVTLLLVTVWSFYAADHPGQHSGANSAERRAIEEGDPTLGVTALRHGGPEIGFWSLVFDFNMVLLNLSYAAYSYSQYLFFYWAQDYIKDVLGYGDKESRIWTAIVLLSMAAGMMCGGLMTDRMQAIFGSRRGRAITPLCGMVASGLVLTLAVFSPVPLGTIFGFALSMGLLGLCEAPFWTTAVEIGRHRGALSGSILNAGGNVGGLLAPVVTPLFSAVFGWKAGLCLASAICILGGLFWLSIRLKEVRPGVRSV